LRVFAYEHPGGIAGGISVVVAEDEEEAFKQLAAELWKHNIEARVDKVIEIDLNRPGAYLLFDGVY